jgi:hypothetical protein
VLQQRGLAAIVVRREGPLKAIVARLTAAGNDVVTLPHHVVVHLAAGPS